MRTPGDGPALLATADSIASRCSVEGCGKTIHARAFCDGHYKQAKSQGLLPPVLSEERFWKKVEKTETCWLWTGGKTMSGYGVFYDDGRQRMAYRYAYERFVGPIPDGLEIDHVCRVRACVNPAHLDVVTHRENMLRGNTTVAANAAKTHCLRGHPFDLLNTRLTPSGKRRCRICDRAARRLRTERARSG
jgi:hypothetical protein